jgi:hypothetical protein
MNECLFKKKEDEKEEGERWRTESSEEVPVQARAQILNERRDCEINGQWKC